MRGLASAVECGCVDGVSCTDTSSREQSELIPRITIATVGMFLICQKINF